MSESQLINLTDYSFKTRIHLRFSDLDAFGHVNNAVYLSYLEVARTHYWDEIIEWDWKKTGIILARTEVDYLVPIVLTDTIYCYLRTSRMGNSSFDIEYVLIKETDGREIICTRGKTVQVAFDYKTNKPVPIPREMKKRME